MSKRITIEEYIIRASAKHNNKFDYSLITEMKSQNSKIPIICPIHGEMMVNAGNHLMGSDCMKCKKKKKRNTKSFLKELKEKGFYYENYDYSLVDYETTNKKVIIIDKKFNTKHSITPKVLLKNGTKCSNSNLSEGYLSFEESKKYIKTKKIKNHSEFHKFYKSGNLPWNIPLSPERKYINEGWLSWGDFLGLSEGWDGEFIEWKKALDYVRSLKLKTQKEWVNYIRKGKLRYDIPTNPHKYYKEWKSFQDWLGTNIGFEGYNYLPFNEAREFVRLLNFKDRKEWRAYCKSGNKPENIPSDPGKVYKYEKFSMGDWLGNGNISNRDKEFLTFIDARDFVRKLNLKSGSEWKKYINSSKYNKSIPKAPGLLYEEYVSMGDWLGYLGDGTHAWTKSYIIDFISSLEPYLVKLDSIELITIINSNNLAKKIKDLGFLEDLISSKGNTVQRQQIIKNITSSLNDLDEFEEDNIDEQEIEILNEELLIADADIISEKVEETELKPLKNIDELKSFDNKMIVASLDDENFDFLLKNQLKKLWNDVLNKKILVKDLQNETGGENFSLIKKWFFEEYNEVIKIKPPKDYIFEYQPNMMQRLVTYRMTKEKRYGNWSGTGAGKTLSAIFSGRYSELYNTVIICNNATVAGWVKSIHAYFSNSNVFVKSELDINNVERPLYNVIPKDNVRFPSNQFNYLILNYETFQLGDGDYLVSELLKNNTIDYIILDEVQNVKQRNPKEESTRRNVINKLVIHSKEHNEDIHLMGMSATPIINNLTEPKKLIELLSGESHDDLETNNSIINGVEMYKHLTRYGIRYKPEYSISVSENIIKEDGTSLKDRLIKVPKGSPIGFEKELIDLKLKSISKYIKKGTLIYTHYVTDLVNVISKYVESLGLTYGLYTGLDKSGLNRFINSKVDVLIGSAPIGTGVDGIQKVCDTLIPLVLPWTSSEYEQLKGRVNRQGSNFKKVNIYLPQIYIPLGKETWSWDKRRYNIIKYKSTLADLAMDGHIPKSLIPSKEKLVKQAQLELKEWIDRMSNDDVITFEREELVIPLNPKQIEYKKRELGNFSTLNQKWSVTRSENTFERLKKDPSEWYYYHTLYSEKRKDWNEIPYKEIAKKINKRTDWLVADMGCGENLLSKEIKNKVHAFDFHAIDKNVEQCDMKNVPLKSGKVDVVVFCLALMAPNYLEHLKEGHRILKYYGQMFICKKKKKMEGKIDKFKSEIEEIGFSVRKPIISNQKFVYFDCTKN